MAALVEEFNTTNEWGITVEATSLGGSTATRDQINLGIVSGELPNLGGSTFVSDAQGSYLADVLLALDPYMNDPTWGFTEDEWADMNIGLLDTGRALGEPFNNQQLAWPVGMSANVNSVSLTMLGELGYDAPPTTLAEFREISCAASELTTADGGDVQGFPIRDDGFDLYSFFEGSGVPYFDLETGYDFTSEGAIAVLTFLQDLYNDGCAYVPEGSFDNTADFALGLNPMAVGSTSGTPFINADIATNNTGIEWVNTTVPYSEGNRSLQLFFRGVGLFNSTPEENLASWLFLKFLASTDAQVAWAQGANYQPYTYSGLNGLGEEYLAANPQINDFRELLIDPDIRLYSAPQHLGVADIAFGPVSALVANITVGGQDVMEAATEATEAANELYQEALEDIGS
jgi:multiple sugar transport system substrate-binding protein/sn-glycerol 3-phosphate transport system substrate-binding protein